jgi:hypothetical protein
VKVAGFLVLLALIFAAAHLAGARVGPVTVNSPGQTSGGGSGTGGGGMNMGQP